jgi:hypothetical protein
MPLSEEFRIEIVNVPFWYPPPSMFFLLPLGWFESISSALAAWYALQSVILVFAAVLLWRGYFRTRALVDLAACGALVLAFYGTWLTYHYGQTNFIALAALLLFWRRRETLSGGAWAAVAVFAKPLLAVLVLWMSISARWKALGGFALGVGALMLAALLSFGSETVGDYFGGDHLGAKPDWIYSQRTNQSLLGSVLRATDAECSGSGCVRNPWFLTAAAALGIVTLAAAIGLRGTRDDEWSLALLVAFALWVYPVSQLFYSVLLLPIVALAWRERGRVAGGAATVALFAAATFEACTLDYGTTTVYGYALAWVAMAIACFALISGRGFPLRRSAIGP